MQGSKEADYSIVTRFSAVSNVTAMMIEPVEETCLRIVRFVVLKGFILQDGNLIFVNFVLGLFPPHVSLEEVD